MIFLFTGVPGAGKTLNTIKFISEDEQFKDRPVYYHNIRDCKLDGWAEIDEAQVKKWYELPKGSVVVLDECQEIFPVAGPRKEAPPEYIEKLAVHRHLGIDLVLITQEPRNINAFARRLVSLHRHHVRHFGTERIKIYEWHNKCAENVHDYHEKQEAIVKQTKLDKKYFGAYHSAEIHTQKARFPLGKAAALLVLPVLVVGYALFSLVSFFMDKSDERAQPVAEYTEELEPLRSSMLPFSGRSEPTVKEWVEAQKPRVDGLPQTAPIYDKLREPKTYPRLVCGYMESRDDCRCITQQGTKVQIDKQLCLNIVKNGIFDYARPDDADRQGARASQQGSIPADRPSTVQPGPSEIVWAGGL